MDKTSGYFLLNLLKLFEVIDMGHDMMVKNLKEVSTCRSGGISHDVSKKEVVTTHVTVME